jgi:hypothetical protein
MITYRNKDMEYHTKPCLELAKNEFVRNLQRETFFQANKKVVV